MNNKKAKISIEEMEQIQLTKIEALGLYQHINYDMRDPAIGVDMTEVYPYAKAKSIQAITHVGLVEKELWDATKLKENIIYSATGISLCSANDTFSKKTGRMLATARALRMYNKHLKEIKKAEKAEKAQSTISN